MNVSSRILYHTQYSWYNVCYNDIDACLSYTRVSCAEIVKFNSVCVLLLFPSAAFTCEYFENEKYS